eukprot:Protomagalhaensia_sp_Gyna_25__43@NODE_101_length_5263_cov_71_008806_g78_i0_p5_GENE_NODE_101_length_5263_cov_71_008806_g78_i0NODE_101_length_5263_cov_71_008806_g78_i0_p5_ORF_typecomplete_len107_score3_33_NODE_101_length_5263_cov_71_008806_g78_i021962516
MVSRLQMHEKLQALPIICRSWTGSVKKLALRTRLETLQICASSSNQIITTHKFAIYYLVLLSEKKGSPKLFTNNVHVCGGTPTIAGRIGEERYRLCVRMRDGKRSS